MVRVTCLGGAGQGVTGSNYLVQTSDGKKLLIDCGLFQGSKQTEAKNWDSWGFDPKEIPVLVLTHAHIDHCGRIPRLVMDGFSGRVHASPPTVELARILLLDSAHIQEINAQWLTRRNRRTQRKEVAPLYVTKDAEACLPLFHPTARDEILEVVPGIRMRLRNAGHILGSCIVELWVRDNNEEVKIVFSGDLGKRDQIIIRDTHEIFSADYLFVESTYGDRLHRSFEESKKELLEAVRYSASHGEKVLIPAFAVERTQEIIYILGEFFRAGLLPDIPIYLDSPLAIKATEIFRKNRRYYDAEAQAILDKGHDPLDLPNLRFTPTTAESAAINDRRGPAIIIAGNGMCTAGRIRHHLKHNLWRPGASLVIAGFQAQGTTGRNIVEGARTIKVFREDVAVRAKIFTIGGFSAHGDQDDLLDWVGHFRESSPKVFPVHGEPRAKQILAEKIAQQFGFTVHIPRERESLLLAPRQMVVEEPGAEPKPEGGVDEAYNTLVSMENTIKDLKKQMGKRWARPHDGDHGLERLRFIQEELSNLLTD